MKAYRLLAMVLGLFLLTAFSVSASPVDVSIYPDSQAVQPRSQIMFNMTITNNQPVDDVFQIYVSGDHVEWYMPALLTKGVKSTSSEQIELLFSVPDGVNGKFPFKAFAASVIHPGMNAWDSFVIDIPYDFLVKSFSTSYAGNSVNFGSVIWTPEEKSVEGSFSFKDGSGKTMGIIPFKEAFDGEKSIMRSFVPKEPLTAGNYTGYLAAGRVTRSAAFYVSPVRSVSQTVEESSDAFGRTVTIAIRNNGNVIEKDYAFQQTTPLDPMTGLMTKPGQNCREDQGTMICDYVISEIKPGSTAYVSYSASSWPAINGYVILAIIISGLVAFSFFKATTPRISKQHSRKGDDRHNISLHVSNQFFRSLSDVMVKDRISPLAQVLHEEIESSAPVITKQQDGTTELIWKLGEMKPREERVLQYKVRSLVNGHIRLPGAHMKFRTRENSEKKIRLRSNGITLGG